MLILFSSKIFEIYPLNKRQLKKGKQTMGNDLETSEPLWSTLVFHCFK